MRKKVILQTTVFMMIFLCACGSPRTINEQALTDLIPEGITESKELKKEDAGENEEVATKAEPEADSVDDPVYNDVMNKIDRSGFDISLNQRRQLGKFDLSIPNYYSINVDTADTVTYYPDEDKKVVVSLTYDDMKLPDGYDVEGFFKGTLDSITFFGTSCEFLKNGDLSLEGYECCSRIYTGKSKETNFVLENDVVYDAKNESYLLATFCQYDQTEYNYFPDFHRVLYSLLGDDVVIDEKTVNNKGNEADSEVNVESDDKETEETAANDTEVPEGVDPEFKEKMDRFEKFFDDYIAFMEKYSTSPDPVGMMKEYTQMQLEYTKNLKDFYGISLGLLSPANQEYYEIVTKRISAKLEENGNN